MANIHYEINLKWPQRHVFEVSCTIPNPAKNGQRIAVPAWIPGSYLIRDFAKHIISIKAHNAAGPVALLKQDKHSWQAGECAGALTIITEVYAFDLSVRGAHFDDLHAFFNGTSLYLFVEGQENNPVDITLLPPSDPKLSSWNVATSLPALNINALGFGTYTAANYAEAIDHPVEISDLELLEFEAEGLPHKFAIFGQHRANRERLQHDLQKVCAQILRFFPAPAPFSAYVFLCTLLGKGHGGLEHRASSALIASRDDVVCMEKEPSPAYRDFLSLVSHEYFHAWNIKQIKPEKFIPYALQAESYTELLWFFEGITAYYQDLFLVRAGLISTEKYLEALAQEISRLYKTPGRLRQTACESSFDAWTRFYQQDSNAPNAIVSYYLKGAMIGLVLDLHLRHSSAGSKSLDDVMRYLWLEYGKPGRGVAEGAMAEIIQAATQVDVSDLLHTLINTTTELPLAEYLQKFAIQLRLRAPLFDEDLGGFVNTQAAEPHNVAILGAKFQPRGSDLVVQYVLEDSPAQRAGIEPEDILVALDGFRIYPNNLQQQLQQYSPGDAVNVHLFRNDTLLQREMLLDNGPNNVCELSLLAHLDQGLLDGWLSG